MAGGNMTVAEFIKWVQGYYGKYPIGQQEDIKQYVQELSPQYLDALRHVIVRRFSSQFGKPPDIAIFEQCKDEALENIEQPGYLQIDGDDDRASPDDIKKFNESIKQLIEAKSFK
jgi:hypothetical protein